MTSEDGQKIGSQDTLYSHEREETIPIAFARWQPDRVLSVRELVQTYAEHDRRVDYTYQVEKLGPANELFEADPTKDTSPGQLAKELAQKTGQNPDVIIVCTSHLPKDRAKQRVALQVREELAQDGMADRKVKTSNANMTISAACPSLVVAFDFLRQSNPVGANVMVIVDETGYRRTLPPPEEDSGKVGLLFADYRIAMQTAYGPDDFFVRSSYINYVPDTQGLLKMRVPDYNRFDPYLHVYQPPYGEVFDMKGPRLMRHFDNAVTEDKLEGLVEQAQLTVQDLSFFLSHQASIRMVEHFNGLFPNIPYRPEGIRKYGNTSSASTVLDMEDGIEAGNIKRGDAGLVVAFGGGLTDAAAVVSFGRK